MENCRAQPGKHPLRSYPVASPKILSGSNKNRTITRRTKQKKKAHCHFLKREKAAPSADPRNSLNSLYQANKNSGLSKIISEGRTAYLAAGVIERTDGFCPEWETSGRQNPEKQRAHE
jgi:hypothetical protein